MSKEELKPCKLCSATPVFANPYWHCSDPGCAMRETLLKADEWNLLMIRPAVSSKELEETVEVAKTIEIEQGGGHSLLQIEAIQSLIRYAESGGEQLSEEAVAEELDNIIQTVLNKEFSLDVTKFEVVVMRKEMIKFFSRFSYSEAKKGAGE